jgi:prepilin-type N-terminal cleavage/methylation domain-containing protein
MMFPKLRLINRSQLGFTLIELTLTMAIAGLIAGGVTMTFLQVVNGSGRTNNHMVAVRQVQNVGYWVNHDAQMAQNVALADESDDNPDGTRFPFTLTWVDWGTNEEHQVIYSLEDMTNGAKQLVRSHSSGGDTETSFIARFIDVTEKDGQPQTRCGFTNGVLTLTVTATVGDGKQELSETRVYEIVPRPGS